MTGRQVRADGTSHVNQPQTLRFFVLTLFGAVQVKPIKLKLKPPGTKRLKLTCDELLSFSAFNFNITPVPSDQIDARGTSMWESVQKSLHLRRCLASHESQIVDRHVLGQMASHE
jgi:hypothetical protein